MLELPTLQVPPAGWFTYKCCRKLYGRAACFLLNHVQSAVLQKERRLKSNVWTLWCSCSQVWSSFKFHMEEVWILIKMCSIHVSFCGLSHCWNRTDHWFFGKWEVQTEPGDYSGVFTGSSDKQVSPQSDMSDFAVLIWICSGATEICTQYLDRSDSLFWTIFMWSHAGIWSTAYVTCCWSFSSQSHVTTASRNLCCRACPKTRRGRINTYDLQHVMNSVTHQTFKNKSCDVWMDSRRLSLIWLVDGKGDIHQRQ